MPIDYNRYPSDWFTRLHRIVWARAEGKCEFCGLAHNQIVYSVRILKYRKGKKVNRVSWQIIPPRAPRELFKQVRVILTKAHLDHDAENKYVHPSRIRLLCQLCHLQYDAAHKAAQRNLKR